MATVPITRTAVAGEIVLATHFNANIRDVLNFLLSPPIFEGRQTAAQTLTTGVWADLNMDVEDVDSANGHSVVTNTARYTATYPGWHEVGGGYGSAINATGIRATRWAVNGNAINGSQLSLPATAATAAQYPLRSKQVFLNAGDYVTPQGFQNSGANLGTDINTTNQSSFMARWVSN